MFYRRYEYVRSDTRRATNQVELDFPVAGDFDRLVALFACDWVVETKECLMRLDPIAGCFINYLEAQLQHIGPRKCERCRNLLCERNSMRGTSERSDTQQVTVAHVSACSCEPSGVATTTLGD